MRDSNFSINKVTIDNIKRYDCDLFYGLNDSQVKERKLNGLYNYNVKPKFKTIQQILTSNIFTYFNIINFVLAICILAVGSLKNIFFIGIVICNIFIGILQEIKSMKLIKKLSIVSQPEVTVIRNGKRSKVKIFEIVLDDIIVLESGNQIAADAIVKEGFVEVDESIITGESNLVEKQQGDMLISGSFIVAGNWIARVENVGKKTYISKMLMDVGEYKNTKSKSEIMKYINTISKIISILIVPIGFLRFYKEYCSLNNDLQSSVVFTVASIIGMIPEGIVLLTSITLAVGVIRLAKLKALTQDLFSIETLARVDVLCLDKTGTLTQGNIEVEDFIKLDNQYSVYDIKLLISNFCRVTNDKGATIDGLKSYFNVDDLKSENYEIDSEVCFSSFRKWSGINFKNNVNIALGAPEILLGSRIDQYNCVIDKYVNEGKRILIVGLSNKKLLINDIPEVRPIALIVMSDKIRENAIETLNFFKQQGVDIKIISGDNAIAVSNIAKLVKLNGSDKYIDATELKSDEDIMDAIKKYNIFGRAKPNQKKKLINAYQKLGYTVGMIGDGVNDILALKDADCSIAMAVGSDAARQISKFVLLDSNFKSVPNIVSEGRRVVNNIMRAASMFLIKNIYSFALSIILLFFATSYPFQPIQLTLLGAITIGLPSFFLALEKNETHIKKNFLKTVLINSLPPSIAIIMNILLINVISYFIKFLPIEISTLAVILTGLCNLMALIRVSKPFNVKHKIVVIMFAIVFVVCVVFFKNIFLLCSLNFKMLIVLLILGYYSYWQINSSVRIYNNIFARSQNK